MSSDSGAFGSFGDFTPSSLLSSTTRPLDLTSLPPELVVILKNVQKRDPTTKSKAIQDLQTKITDGLDDLTLDLLLPIWVIHPRSSPQTNGRSRSTHRWSRILKDRCVHEPMEHILPYVLLRGNDCRNI